MIHTGAAVAAGMSQGRLTPHDKFKLDCTKVHKSRLVVCSSSLPPSFPFSSLRSFLLHLPLSLCVFLFLSIFLCVCMHVHAI